jgi:hypothetical protein
MLLALNISQGSFLPGLKYPLALIVIISGQIKNQNSNFIFLGKWVSKQLTQSNMSWTPTTT